MSSSIEEKGGGAEKRTALAARKKVELAANEVLRERLMADVNHRTQVAALGPDACFGIVRGELVGIFPDEVEALRNIHRKGKTRLLICRLDDDEVLEY